MDGILPDWVASTSDMSSPQDPQTQQVQQQQQNLIQHLQQQPQDQHQHQQYQPVQPPQPQSQPTSQQPPGPQNGPSTSTYRPRKKLRESCNNCALSKVKCTKEHPQCQRCEDREMYCHYSPTRRTGKRRANSQTAPNPNPNANANSNPSGVPPMQIKELTPTPPAEPGYFDYSSLVLNHGMSMNPAGFSGISTQMLRVPESATMNMKPTGMIRNFSSDMFPESLDPGLFSELDQLGLSLSPVVEGHGDMDVTMGDYDNEQHQDLIFSLLNPGANEGASGFALGTGGGTSTNRGNYSSGSSSDGLVLGDYGSQHCVGRALEILAKLHNAPINCTLSTSIPPSGSARDGSSSTTPSIPTLTGALPTPTSAPTPLTATAANLPANTHSASSTTTRTIDQVLATNKETVKAVHRILDCPCSLNLQTALILTAIVSKVLCWYAAVGRAQSENSEWGFARPSSPEFEPTAGRGSSNMSMSLNLSPTPTSTRTSTPTPGSTPMEYVSLSAPSTFVNKYALSKVNGRDASRISAQLVLGELHLVLRLVKKLVARFRRIEGEGRVDASSPEEGEAAEDGGRKKASTGGSEGGNSAGMPVLVEMERFLLDQLKALARETTEVLRVS